MSRDVVNSITALVVVLLFFLFVIIFIESTLGSGANKTQLAILVAGVIGLTIFRRLARQPHGGKNVHG